MFDGNRDLKTLNCKRLESSQIPDYTFFDKISAFLVFSILQIL